MLKTKKEATMKKKVWYFLYLLLDIGIVLFSFAVVAWFHDGTKSILVDYAWPVLGLSLAWVCAGLIGGKFSIKHKQNLRSLWSSIVKCDAVAIAIVFGTIIFFDKFEDSRYIVFGTIGLTVIIEVIIFTLLYYSFKFHKDNPSFAKTTLITKSAKLAAEGSTYEMGKLDPSDRVPESPLEVSKDYCLDVCTDDDSVKSVLQDKYLINHEKVFEFLNEHLNLTCFCKQKSYIINSHSIFNIENIDSESQSLFINLHKANNFRRINKYIIKVNENLVKGGVFCGCMETKNQRRRRFIKRFTPLFGNIIYFIDFIVRRVFPKLALLKGLYFAITKGKNRVFSETEFLGRLYFCGFELLCKREIEGINYFIAIKTKEPSCDENPSYGPLIRLKRKGKDGKTIYVNKLRTMHAYSEYLQDYVYQTSGGTIDGDGFKNDFRITSWGKVFRKLWIDELPMIMNLLKGEVKIVGVRPLSFHKFSLYSQDMQELRVKTKPGLVPPFYADLPKNLNELQESERKYIESYLKKPFRTDVRYFCKAFYNIVFKKARSK